MIESEKHPHIPARAIFDRIVLGGSDGAMEGLAMTAALNGAGLAFGTITLAGLAFAIAGAISMFFSSFLSRRSEISSLKIDLAREKMEIETEPEEEKSEMRGLLRQDGYDEKEVEMIIGRFEKDKGLWLREMLRREIKVNPEDVRGGAYSRPTFAGLAFFLLALLAVGPYAFSLPRESALIASVSLSLGALFALGSRVFIPRNFRPLDGLESALVGGAAGVLLYIAGILISKL